MFEEIPSIVMPIVKAVFNKYTFAFIVGGFTIATGLRYMEKNPIQFWGLVFIGIMVIFTTFGFLGTMTIFAFVVLFASLIVYMFYYVKNEFGE